MNNYNHNEAIIPPFYAKELNGLLIIDTNCRDLQIFGSVSAKLPSQLKFKVSKEKTEGNCAILKVKNGYAFIENVVENQQEMNPFVSLRLELSIYPMSLDAGTYYLCNTV
jgi:hypothetical protein